MIVNVMCINAKTTNEAVEDTYKKIEYIEELGGFSLKNVTVNELLDIMNNAGFKESAFTNKQSVFNDSLTVIDMDTPITPMANVHKGYSVSISTTGIYNEVVYVDYELIMEIKYVTYQGVQYAQFVSFTNSFGKSVRSHAYEEIQGSMPVVQILNGGATLTMTVPFQLRTLAEYEKSGIKNSSWTQATLAVNKKAKYKSPLTTKSTTLNLPLKNAMS